MQETSVTRLVFDRIWREMDSHTIVLLNGARQVGKTTLIRALIQRLKSERGVPDSHIFYFDLERTEHLLVWGDQESALSVLPRAGHSERYYLFIDEFQHARTIGSTLKVIHDHHPYIKTVMTGSASWYLNIDESLAGRKTVIPVWPFSFEEYLMAHHDGLQLKLLQNNSHSPHAVATLNQTLKDFLIWGGYPAVVRATTREDKARVLSELVDAYLLKDIRLWQYAANSLEVRKLLALLASQTGSLLSRESVARSSGLGLTALKNRLELFSKTFVTHLLSPHFTNKQKELIKQRKVFFADNGFRNVLLENFTLVSGSPDEGALAEQFVVSELTKRQSPLETLRYWRTKAGTETDIVLVRDGRLLPVEVKAGDMQRIPSGLAAFIRAYRPGEAYVLNKSIVSDTVYESCSVHFRPLWYAAKL